MLGIEALGTNAQAAALVGVVLAEAVLLYVVYGFLERALGGPVTRVLQGRCAVMDLVFGRCSAAENGGAGQ
ncbi:MAG: hypothetical protein V5A44_02815 [Haloarculaceae archaeon]